MYRCRVQRRRPSMLTMAPSTIHHINSDTVDIISPELDRSIIEVSKSALRAGELLRVQAVQIDGLWFALNSAQLDLCRRLEDDGSCKVVLVDPVPAAEVPRDVRRMMKLPVDGRSHDRMSMLATNAGSEAPEVDNGLVADVPEVQEDVGTAKAGGKGYRMLNQADPMDATDNNQTPTTNPTEGQLPTEDDDVIRALNTDDLDLELDPVEKVEGSDVSSEEDSTDSECDWSEEAGDTGSEDENARMADTSDEMSSLL